MFAKNKKLIILLSALLVTACSLVLYKPTNAGILFTVSDTLSRTKVSVSSNHEIAFTLTLPTTVIQDETITINFPSDFAGGLNGIDCGDIDLLDDGDQEDLNNEAGGCIATGIEWGASVVARVLTLTAPSNPGTYIDGSSDVIIRIGANTTEEGVGDEQVTNPAVAGSHSIHIGGTFGDSKTFAIYIIDNEQVSVSAEVVAGGAPPAPPPPAPGPDPDPDPDPEDPDDEEPEEDIIPPVISDVEIINITHNSAEIIWNTDEGATSIINYGLDPAYGSVAMGVAFVLEHSVALGDLEPLTTYHFSITSTDAWGNTTISGDYEFTTLNDIVPPANIIAFAAESTERRTVNLTWRNPADPDLEGILIRRSFARHPESPDEGELIFDGLAENFEDITIDEDHYNIPTYYTAFSYDASGNYSAGALARVTIVVDEEEPEEPCEGEDCPPEEDPDDDGDGEGEGDDDDGDGDDGDDGAAGGGEEGDDGEDDVDAIVDELLGERASAPVAGEEKINIADFHFFGANGTIELFPTIENQFFTLIEEKILLKINTDKFEKEVDRIVIVAGRSSYLLVNNGDVYETNLEMTDRSTILPFSIVVQYEDDSYDRINGSFSLLGPGLVTGENEQKLEEVSVSVFLVDTDSLWPGALFSQRNPMETNSVGEYSFMLPQGKYYLTAEKEEYYSYRSGIFGIIGNNVVNEKIKLTKKEIIIPEEKEEGQTIVKTVVSTTKNIAEKISEGGKIIQEKVLENPEVEKVNEKIAAPAIATVAIVSYGTAISLTNLLPYLQFLFTQPFLLFFRKKRKGWGVVYNSLSKLPVDLAIVRLYDEATNRLIQTRVTDKEGRFAFFTKPGQYKIAVSKQGFNFPSNYLQNKREDIEYLDIYHGEKIAVNENDTTITPNIPVDPKESKGTATDKKILLSYFGRKLQDLIALSGLVLATASVIISPKLWIIGLLAGHMALYFLMKRLARPSKTKDWGIVYDGETKKPLGRTVARIFEKEYNKLVETQVTDSKGRYSFLVGNNKYYATFSKPQFKTRKTEEIDLTDKDDEAIIKFNVALEKNNK